MKKKTAGIVIIILIGSILINIVLFCKPYINKEVTATGTYMYGQQVADPSYIVLTEDGNYYNYKQFEMLDEDQYSIDESGIVTLQDSEQETIICVEDKLYYIESDNTLVYEKVSDSPTFINVNE